MPDGLMLLLGVAAAAAGGEMFVRGAVGLAAWLRIPAGIVGATVAAFATSAPELAVALNAVSSNQPEIPLGDALGSNVTNIALVLGIAIVIRPIPTGRAVLRRELPFALLAPALTGVFIADGRLGRLDAAAMLLAFATWLAITVMEVRRSRSAASETMGETAPKNAVTYAVAGVALLVLAGRLVVVAASGIGKDFGIDSFIVGATLVAVGTSVPELATTLISVARGHAEVGIGTLLGSNIFNNLWIVGWTAALRPVSVEASDVAVALAASGAVLLMVIPGRNEQLRRWRGSALLSAYGLYVSLLLVL